MAATKETKTSTKSSTKTTSSSRQKAQPSKEKEKVWVYAVIAVLGMLVLYALYFILANYVQTTFTTFKGMFISAPKVAIALVYNTIPQYSASYQCALSLTQVVAHTRAVSNSYNYSSMSFLIMNKTACVYQQGLGYPINIQNATTEQCMQIASTMPTIFLNYSTYNSTNIVATRLFIHGDASYMQDCPLLSEFS